LRSGYPNFPIGGFLCIIPFYPGLSHINNREKSVLGEIEIINRI
jgi:hypothetical protein